MRARRAEGYEPPTVKDVAAGWRSTRTRCSRPTGNWNTRGWVPAGIGMFVTGTLVWSARWQLTARCAPTCGAGSPRPGAPDWTTSPSEARSSAPFGPKRGEHSVTAEPRGSATASCGRWPTAHCPSLPGMSCSAWWARTGPGRRPAHRTPAPTTVTCSAGGRRPARPSWPGSGTWPSAVYAGLSVADHLRPGRAPQPGLGRGAGAPPDRPATRAPRAGNRPAARVRSSRSTLLSVSVPNC